ncbi:MAG: type II secretion system protein N [Sterolibacterium sp.]
MRLRLVGFAFFILCFLLAIVILWPASALSPWVERASSGHWRLASAEGSVWNGSGMLLARSGDSASWNIVKNIRWQLRWGDLWRGRIGVATTFGQGSSLIAATAKGLSLEQLDATLPAPMILALLPGALGRYGWGGNLRLRSNAFRCVWHTYACLGEIELLWNNAEVAEVPGKALGDYRFRLVGEGQTLRVDLFTLRGRLQINGTGDISARGLRFNGEATATGSNAASLNAVLNVLGRRTGIPGKYVINYREIGTGQKKIF